MRTTSLPLLTITTLLLLHSSAALALSPEELIELHKGGASTDELIEAIDDASAKEQDGLHKAQKRLKAARVSKAVRKHLRKIVRKRKANKTLLATIVAKSGTGESVSDVLKEGSGDRKLSDAFGDSKGGSVGEDNALAPERAEGIALKPEQKSRDKRPRYFPRSIVHVGQLKTINVDANKATRMLNVRQGRFVACHRRALQRNSKVSGEVVFELSLGKQGRVQSGRVKRTTLHDAALDTCILRVLKRLRYPRTGDSSEGSIVIPLELNPKHR